VNRTLGLESESQGTLIFLAHDSLRIQLHFQDKGMVSVALN